MRGHFRMSRKPHVLAFRASLFYGVAAGLWILFSDRLLTEFVQDENRRMQLETYKGWAFVAFTGLMFFLILRQLLASEQQKIQLLQRAETLTNLQRETLERFALGKPLKETLERLLLGIEALSPEMLGSVLLLEGDGRHLRHGAAPSLPDEFNRAIDGAAIGPKVGSCGTAAFRGSPVFVSDLARDPLWTDYKHLALPHGLRACWSTPILDEQKKVLGTFAIYHRTTGLPSAEDVRIIELVTHTVATGLIKLRAEKALRESEERFRTLVEQASDAIFVHDVNGKLLDANQSACQELGYSRQELLQMSVTDVDKEITLAEAQKIWSRLQPGQSQLLRGHHHRKNGTTFPVEVNVTCYEFQGQPVMAALARNLSERKEYEEQLAQSVSLLRATIESSASGLLVVNSEGRVTTYNNRFLEMWRIPAKMAAAGDDQMMLKLVLEQVQEPDEFMRRIAELYRDPEQESYDIIRFKDGRVYDRVARPQRLGDKIAGRVWSFRDITENEHAQEATKHEQQLLRTLVDLAPDFIFVKDTESRFLVANESLAKCYHCTPADMLGHTDAKFIAPELAARFRRSELEVITTGTLHNYEDTICFPDGLTRTVVTNMVAFRDARGCIGGLVGIGRDITTQKATEQSMRLQSVSLNAAANAVVITDPHGHIEWVNPAFTRTTGYTLAEAVGKNPRDLINAHKHGPEFFRRMWQTILAGEVWNGELINQRKNGELYHEEMTITPLVDEKKKVTHFIAIKQDITERKAMEQSLLKTQAMYSSLVEQMPVCVFRKNTAGRYEFANWRFCELKGLQREDIIGRTPQEVAEVISRRRGSDRQSSSNEREYAIEGEGHHELIMKEGRSIEVDREFLTPDGQRRFFHVVKSPVYDNHHHLVGSQGVLFDITDKLRTESERQNLETQLRQSQKMEAIGQLSGGIAHDFNNILTVIQGNAALLQGLDLQPEEIRDCSNQIARAGERAASLTRQLLMFARKQQMQPVDLDLNETVAQMTKMLQRILGEDITLRYEYAPALPLIHADVGMIEQIILNLAVNARDAMPNGGKLTISMRMGNPHPEENSQATPLTHICLAIADTGVGIAPQIMPHIFEPFFTTKEIGKGTGLGLATVYGIVQQHHGEITAQSEPGQGTTFKVYFPIATTRSSSTTAITRRSRLVGGSETILLVEDEVALCAFVSELLQRCGYTVLEANSGPAALKVWQQHKDRIQLLLTDIIMPENVNGIELGRRLLQEKPALKVVHTSGYTGNLEGRHSTLIEGVNFIRKPFKPEAIAEIIRKNLDDQAAGK